MIPPGVDQSRLTVFLAVLGLMYLAESLRPERPWETPRLRRLAMHGLVAGLNAFLTRFLVALPLLWLAAWAHERSWGLAGVMGLSGLPEILATLVLFDSFDYWWHRFNHTIPFLWRFHRVHHIDTHVDVTTSLRFHVGELCLSGLAKAAWILLWGPSVWGFAIFETGITAFSQFHHSNIDFADPVEGILRWFHMTPRLHAAHHTVTLRTRNANYSTIFIAWDRLFGTFRKEDREELRRLGLEEGREGYLDLRTILLAPFVG